jgi:cytosine/adenosine deaminase-related metal-dependent hydrolase
VAEADLRLAKAMNLVVSMHHSGGAAPEGVWGHLEAEGLLGPWVNLVHANGIDDPLLARLVSLGASFTITPEVELGDGHGQPITGRLRRLGASPSLGVDIESAISGEVLTAARFALAHQRALDHAEGPRSQDALGVPSALDALGWATIEGARALGLADRIGSLEIGKQADLVMIDARALNLWPVNSLAAAALQASLANIEAVMIAGRWRKRGGKLFWGDLSDVQRALSASSRRIRKEAGLAAEDPAEA